MPMTPYYETMAEKPPREPRELGELKTEFRPRIVPLVDHVTSIKAHLRGMSMEELTQMAREIRGGKLLRLCNDEVLAALLRVWAS